MALNMATAEHLAMTLKEDLEFRKHFTEFVKSLSTEGHFKEFNGWKEKQKDNI
jgi:hypothetical protein